MTKKITNGPGWQSTEFLLSSLAIIVGMVLASGVLGEETQIYQLLAWLASTLAAIGYTGCRTLLKRGEQQKEIEQMRASK